MWSLTPVVFLLLFTSFVSAADAGSDNSPPVPELDPPGPSVFRMPRAIGWGENATPNAPTGFRVEKFAEGLDSPRWLYVLPNGDVLVSQSRTETLAGMPTEVVETLTRQGMLGISPDNIILLRQSDRGLERSTFLSGLRQPFGMVLLGDFFYVANTDSLLRFRYQRDATSIESEPETLVEIPAGGQGNPWNNHWTRNIVVHPDGSKMYLSVGAGSDVDPEGIDPPDRAAIWELNPDGTGKRLFATGLRNPVGMDFDPVRGDLWVTVNERDGLGDEVPPDFLTRVVDGEFYGWPYVYFGTYPDPTHQRLNPDRVALARQTARVPDLALGGHTVPLGLLFYRGESFPDRYRHGAFVARRGGVGRASFLGFDVVFIPMESGAPVGPIEPFLTGFIADNDEGTVHGRPVGLATLPDGSMLVTDDSANVIWRILSDDHGSP